MTRLVVESKSGIVRLAILQSIAPQRKTIQDMVFEGGPGRLQFGLDARRLYVTNSFFRPWVDQIYRNLTKLVYFGAQSLSCVKGEEIKPKLFVRLLPLSRQVVAIRCIK